MKGVSSVLWLIFGFILIIGKIASFGLLATAPWWIVLAPFWAPIALSIAFWAMLSFLWIIAFLFTNR